jgi:hemoglobin
VPRDFGWRRPIRLHARVRGVSEPTPTGAAGATPWDRRTIPVRYVAPVNKVPSLFEWAGGRDAFDRMINAFYDRVEQDELLSPFFPGGVHVDHRHNVATWWSEVFGGQAQYSEQLGGYERMLEKHRGLGITDEQRLRFATLMSLAADDAQMPTDPEFRSALVAYLEWGTRLALGNSQTDADVIEHAPVPRWGWGEAPPYQP